MAEAGMSPRFDDPHHRFAVLDETSPAIKFIAGEPMNPATKTFAGLS